MIRIKRFRAYRLPPRIEPMRPRMIWRPTWLPIERTALSARNKEAGHSGGSRLDDSFLPGLQRKRRDGRSNDGLNRGHSFIVMDMAVAVHAEHLGFDRSV